MSGPSRRDVLAAAGASALAGIAPAACGQDAPGERRRPNVLLVMVDELAWDSLGCAGNPVVRTPHLDALAAQSARFERAFTVAPICAPSRRSFFTGRYAHVHGVVDNRTAAHDGELLLPTYLQHAGYETAISGKLHHRPVGSAYGFDAFWSTFREGPGELERYPDYLKRVHGRASVNVCVPDSRPFPDDPLGADIGRFPYPAGDFASAWLTDRAIEFLRARRDASAPWFLFASYRVPHTPYFAPEPYFSMYDPAELDVPPIPPGTAERRAAAPTRLDRRHLVDDPALLRALTAAVYGLVTNADDEIGRLLGALEEQGLADDTVVVFTSDHGNMLGQRGLFLKGVMYERAVRVPLWLRLPPAVARAHGVAGTPRVEAVAECVDLLPTVLELCGAAVPAGVQGRSLLPLLRGEEDGWKDRAFAERKTRMVRTRRHKLIETLEPGRFELYDVEADPLEERDLAGEPEHAALVAALAEDLRAWRLERPAPPRVPGLAPPDYAVLDAGRREAFRVSDEPDDDD